MRGFFMFWLFFIFALIFVPFFVLSRKYANPYKLFFIFGKKGAGKSLYMVKLMLRYLKRGWSVYTDISNINIPGVRIISAKDLGTYAPEPKAAIFLDEAGILFDNRNFKNFDTGLRDFFKLQRKYQCRVYLNSQSFDIDKKIRDVTDAMGLMVSLGNVISVYRPIRRSITLTAPTSDSESRIADKLSFESIFHWKFTFMPRYFKYFDSYSAPVRPVIPFEEIPGAIKDLSEKSVKRLLHRHRG